MWNPNVLNWPSWIHVKLGSGMLRIIKQRNEEGTLPERFQKYVGMKAKNFPTIRSSVQAKPGWCFAEADYQTAEMRGLAYISGDPDLIRLIEEPDTCFALVKPSSIPEGLDPEDCICRIAFEPYIHNPPDRHKYLMTCTINNELKATFTEDDLLLDENGKIVSPRFDMHWGVLELARNEARESLDKKKDRGAGKVINFCIAENQLVDVLRETKAMRVPIQDVADTDKVWDGDNWVNHGGVNPVGWKYVFNYQGLKATANHEVWDKDGNKLQFGQAYANKTKLKPTTPAELEEYIAEPDTTEGAYAPCYDILDAGPNSRYTCNGILVSNSSSYGGQAPSLARKIEADIGVKVSLDFVEDVLDAIEKRQPRATAYFKDKERVPVAAGYIRAASGRIRHTHVLETQKGFSNRTRESQIAALGRECRNFEMQESVASTASRACKWLLDFGLKTGLQGYLSVCLYDSCVVHCPWEERTIWGKALHLYMHLANGWKYGGRVLRYPIDLEYNSGWSTKAEPTLHAALQDPTWCPTPDSLKHIESWLDAQIDMYKNNAALSVKGAA